jgi:four helix bundle protein
MSNQKSNDQLKILINLFVHNVYKVAKVFPKNELYGITSQFRRAAISVILNYIEGYARNKNKINKQFLKYSYGSLKETEYIIEFSFIEKYLSEKNFQILIKQADRIGGMLYCLIYK